MGAHRFEAPPAGKLSEEGQPVTTVSGFADLRRFLLPNQTPVSAVAAKERRGRLDRQRHLVEGGFPSNGVATKEVFGA